MDIAIIVFELLVLVFSAVLHEAAHGYEAQHLGDDTAERAGRLTLNPLKHLDPILSFVLPIVLFFSTGMLFGGAKPVPYNPNNLKDPRMGSIKIGLAGPITNLCIALFFGIVSVLLPIASAAKNTLFMDVMTHSSPFFGSPLEGIYFFFLIIVLVNVSLGIFNLVPIPPLDGSKLWYFILPRTESAYRAMYVFEKYGLILVMLFAYFGFEFLLPIMNTAFALFTGHL